MKVVGFVLLCIALVLAGIAATMSVSVGSFGGRAIVNADLLNTRSNLFMLAGFLFVASVMCLVFGGLRLDGHKKNNSNNSGNEENLGRRFKGQRDLENALYKEFLVSTFRIRRSDVLNEFIVGGRSFENLADALKFADESYRNFLEVEANRLKEIKMGNFPEKCPHCLAEFQANAFLSRYHCSDCSRDIRYPPKATLP
jgi:hypothetical protein